MKCDVKVRVDATVELKPYDKVHILTGENEGKIRTIRRIIEDGSGVKVIFTNDSWRPIHTYGLTWQKCLQEMIVGGSGYVKHCCNAE